MTRAIQPQMEQPWNNTVRIFAHFYLSLSFYINMYIYFTLMCQDERYFLHFCQTFQAHSFPSNSTENDPGGI